ncbi:MAG: ABC transporter ATP-binding protein [Trueperaceae bacterium]|nr:MAG: ABC transporter ATP-binding protein [Trueperaceae bacterium]
MSTAVKMTGIVKRFPLVLANDRVDFEVEWGEIHALIGENGAGKSTLMKILYGLQPADAGFIEVNGQRVSITSAKDAIGLGIGMVHQHFMLVEPLTVTDNIVLGAEPTNGPSIDYRSARQKTSRLIEQFGFDISPQAKIEDLPVGQEQQVEILKTLYREARILIMDEPTAVLTPQETRGLFRFLRDFADQGNTVIFISHKLEEVMEISDRISVMRDGKMIITVAQTDTDQRQLANYMVGREVILHVDKTPASPQGVKLEVRELSVRHEAKGKRVVESVSFKVRAGEILGIAGIEGNGQSELVECLAGLLQVESGQILMSGTDITQASSRQRRESGLSHVPEDRNERGLIPTFTAAMNCILGDYHQPPFSSRFGFLQQQQIEAHAKEVVDAYDIRPPSTSLLAARFSGGNAQKLVVARELERHTEVLLLAQPTRGVDIGAIEFIHQQIVRARDLGIAVLLVSADLNEIMSLSDRILVMYEGRITGELEQADATAEKLGLLMAGATPESEDAA